METAAELTPPVPIVIGSSNVNQLTDEMSLQNSNHG